MKRVVDIIGWGDHGRARSPRRLATLSEGLVFCAAMLALACNAAARSVNPDVTIPAQTIGSVGPLSGVYSLYAELRMEGQNAALNDIVQPRYLESLEGSSLAEMYSAATAEGSHAIPLTDMTTTTLRASPYHILLHLRADPLADWKYDHWVLYMGMIQGQAELYEPPRTTEYVPFEELDSRWDGTGLVVSTTPISTAALLSVDRRMLFLFMAVAVAGVGAISWVRRRWPPPPRIVSRKKWVHISLAQTSVVCAVAVVGAVAYHASAADGFIRRPDLAKSVSQAYVATFAKKLTSENVDRLLSDTSVTFVDARLQADYDEGHLKGARNIPAPDVDPNKIEGILAGVARTSRIVVYCQSSGCPFAKKVATVLVSKGYQWIDIYPDGWSGWEAYQDRIQKK